MSETLKKALKCTGITLLILVAAIGVVFAYALLMWRFPVIAVALVIIIIAGVIFWGVWHSTNDK